MVFGGGEPWNKKTLHDWESAAIKQPAPYRLKKACRVLPKHYFGLTRKIYAWRHGPIDPLLYVCHRCDNPKCIEDSHLFLGTQKENMQDAAQKNRTHKGERKSLEHCAAISASKRGRVVISNEHRKKISTALKGRTRSPEHCANISLARKRWWAQRKEIA